MTQNEKPTWRATEVCWSNRMLYLYCALASVLVAFLLVACVPKTYISQIKIADEHKETDLIVGLSDWSAFLKQGQSSDVGLGDPNVYPLILHSPDFIQELSRVRVQKYGITYYQYLAEHHREAWWTTLWRKMSGALTSKNDSLQIYDIIKHNLKYQISGKYYTVVIQASDNDRVVAAEIVTQAVKILEKRLRDKRAAYYNNQLEQAVEHRKRMNLLYKEAQRAYAAYHDAHIDTPLPSEKAKLNSLEEERDKRFYEFGKASEQYIRAKALAQKAAHPFSILKNATVSQHHASPSLPVYILTLLSLSFVALTWLLLYKKSRRCGSRWSSMKDAFSPWMISLFIWAAIVLLLQIPSDLLYPLKTKFYTALVIWLPIFCIAAAITYQVLPKVDDEQKACISDFPYRKWLFDLLFTFSCIMTPIYVYQILKIVMMFDTTDLLYNIRMLAIGGDRKFGILNYTYIINQVLFVIAIWQYPNVKRWKLIVLVIANCMGCFAIMEKGGLFFMITTALFVLYEKKVIRARSIVVTLGIIVLLFFVFNWSKEIKSDDAAESTTFLDFFAIYVLSPPVAFERVSEELTTQFGTNTLQYFYLFLNRFGGNFEVHQRMQEFVFVPLPTNVYTIFQPFYQDFRFAGVAFFAMVYGVFTGWIYRHFRNGSGIGRCVYAYIVEILFLQFYSESLLQNLVLFIQFVFFTYIILEQKITFTIRKTATS